MVSPPKSVSRVNDLEIRLSRPVLSAENVIFRAECDTLAFHEMAIGSGPEDSVYYDRASKMLIVKAGFFKDFPGKPANIWLSKSDLISPLAQTGHQDGEFHFDYQSVVVSVRIQE